ncbi:mechanosensitive ion channel family protein [Cyanothece sp. BG0011]|uniref:mechanosensitive ion channel family protein n=1 Tax=Cyanothece sp. BG0011 TaxID=2082950 RepID=UPI000D1F8AF0|nr:mechanosensitive ion channel domain-containing protein [Cyanothece sp. BG0011]
MTVYLINLMMHRLRKILFKKVSSLSSLLFKIFIFFTVSFLIITTIYPIIKAQTPVIFAKVSTSSPSTQDSRLSQLQQNPEIQGLMKKFNISGQEAQQLLEKRQDLYKLGLFSLSSGKLGNIQYRAVKLDGRIVLPVAANIEDNGEALKVRVKRIENTLNEIVRRNISPKEIGVFPSILNQETVLVISPKSRTQDRESDIKQRWLLMTITAADSRLYGVPTPVLAKIGSQVVDEALEKAWRSRQPQSILQQTMISVGILIVMIIASWLLLASHKYLVPRQKQNKSIFWNRKLLLVGHAIIWFPGMGFILRGFPDSYEIGRWLLDNTVTISTSIISFLLISRFLDIIVKFSESQEKLKAIPIRVFVQLFYILIAILFILIIVSKSINQPLTNIVAAVGAGSAILMIIFKDSIMGFTAGLQLAANRMIALGDWIEMPKYGADGFIDEVNLFTVKVLNWDNTITSIPTYALISDSFKNWRIMFESGVRKIQRSVYIDITSIRFCDPEMLERFSNMDYIGDEIKEQCQRIKKDNLSPLDEKWLSNISVFRTYMMAYLKAHPKISPGPYFLVRQLHPTEHGLPIEVYVYCTDTAWARYEEVQSTIFDHMFCMIPQFDLRVFQSPSSYDFTTLRMSQKSEVNNPEKRG